MDHFTKWAEAIALPDQDAPTVAKAIVTKIFSRHGVCRTHLSDRGRNVTSDLVREVCRLLRVKKVFTSPYRPNCYG
jgi:hypothetical protein